jgi:dTDP-4-dehydrorhamnose reductase
MTLILGASGQLGLALREHFPDATFVNRREFDISDPAAYESSPFAEFDVVINAAAYTAVDQAETVQGRREAWASNVTAVGLLANECSKGGLTLVHVSSDYVFDGLATNPYLETDVLCPVGVYGQTKAAGDVVVSTVPKHYILRTSWVIGDGNNFVRTMASLADRGIAPSVVNDQIGRLTFTDDLARGIKHLLTAGPAFGTYNLTSGGEFASWAVIASRVFELTGHDSTKVTGVSTAEYYAGKEGIAPRPTWSVLDTSLIEATGFSVANWEEKLAAYLSSPAS